LSSLISSIIFDFISSDTGAFELAKEPLVHFGQRISLIKE
jgi:hypothetical protein